MVLKYHISRQLSFGYDIGRGYVAGEEEVSKLIDHMIDNKDIAKQLQRVSDNSRLEVIKMLGTMWGFDLLYVLFLLPVRVISERVYIRRESVILTTRLPVRPCGVGLILSSLFVVQSRLVHYNE